MDILEKIKRQYDSFHKVRRRISDEILGSPGACCFLSLKEFAAAADVTETTVLNYCRSLGLSSYVELRKELQAHMLKAFDPGDRYEMAAATRRGSAEALYQDMVKSEKDALRDTFHQNDMEKLFQFNCYVRGARRIFVAGHDISRILGDYLIRCLQPLGADITMLNLEDKQQMFSSLTACPAEETLVVAIAFPPYGQRTLDVADYCRKAGIPLVSITDSPISPLAREVEASLICHTELIGLTNSAASIVSVITLLSVLYSFERDGQKKVEKDRFAALRSEFEDCFQNSSEEEQS